MAFSPKTQRIFEVLQPNQLHVWLRDYLLDVRAANRAEATITFYRQKLETFLAFLEAQGVTEPEQILL